MSRLAGEPIRLGRHTLPNRLVMTPHLGRLSHPRFLDYLRARTTGGAGLVVTPAGGPVYGASAYATVVNQVPAGYHSDLDATLPWAPDPAALASWEPMARFLGQQAEIVHAGGSVLVGQIHHPGAERSWDTLQPSLAPSAVDGEWPAQHPHAVTDTEIDALVAGYVANAELVVAAGLDGVEVHAAHGYLINRFLSPAYNHRVGRYGGSVEARWAVLREILSGIRAAVGPDALLGVRLPAFEQVADGLSADEVAAGVASCAEWLDYVNLSVGNHDGLVGGRPVLAYTSPWLAERPSLLPACTAIRAASGLPVVVTGGFVTAAGVEEALAAGADLVGVARAVIADPLFVAKVVDDGDVVECIGCNECVLVPMACPVNPAAGREAELRRPRSSEGKRVVVVGGGPAGLSAALAAHARGNQVVVLETRELLGGRLQDLVRDPARLRFASMLARLVGAARGSLDVRTGHPFRVEDLADLSADVLVMATGAPTPTGSLPSDGSVEVFTSDDVLRGRRPRDDGEIVVVGGTEAHLDPLMSARLLASEGRRVRLESSLVSVAPGLEQRTLNHLLHALAVLKVEIHTSTNVTAVARGEVELEHLLDGAVSTAPAAAVVLAHTRVPDASLLDVARATGTPTYVVGDALAPRRLTHAVLEGTRFGLSL
jgi:2,4-dienoyl-CoA reductase (NADPH2)